MLTYSLTNAHHINILTPTYVNIHSHSHTYIGSPNTHAHLLIIAQHIQVIDVFLEFPIHRNTISTFLEDNSKKNSSKMTFLLLESICILLENKICCFLAYS